jgi:very-short-patch-repair endonuclease
MNAPSKSQWGRIRAFYQGHEQALLTERADRWALDPYEWAIDAGITLTPIEEALWQDLRQAGVVMYPQYPVGRFFVDFANPKAKVAIECDGAQWHQDKAKDAARDQELQGLGWTVYRITGSHCVTTERDVQDEYGRQRHEPSVAQRAVRDIAHRHGISMLGTSLPGAHKN